MISRQLWTEEMFVAVSCASPEGVGDALLSNSPLDSTEQNLTNFIKKIKFA
jgi:hypothetical protein